MTDQTTYGNCDPAKSRNCNETEQNPLRIEQEIG